MLKIIVFLYLVGFSAGSSILVVFPVPEKSYSILGDYLVRTLLSVGHEVTYVTPFPKEELHNLEYVAISPIIEKSDKLSLTDIDKDLVLESLGTKLTQQALKHSDMQALMMNETVHFDVIVAHWYYTGLLAPLSSIFECPLVWFSHSDVSWQSLSLVHASFPTTSADLSIKDRVYEMASQLHLAYRNYYHFSSTEMSAYEDSYKAVFESQRMFLPNYEFLVYNASFLLFNSHPMFGGEWSLPPNAKYIGGYHLSDRVSQLPKNLKKLLDESEEGVIYVDLETKMINLDEHQNFIQQLTVFSRIKQSVILKNEEMLLNLPKNVHIMRNPPLQSILSHINTLAYISHGDTTHFISAVHHAVPMIVIPALKEQETLTRSMVKKGLAIRVDVKELWRVTDAVKMIMGNVSYKENMKVARTFIRHRLSSPKEDLTHWLQAATLHGSTLLRHSPRSSVVERYNLDILILILLFLWFCSKLVKLFNAHLYSDEDLEKKDD